MPERSKESVVSKTLFISFHSGNSGLLWQVIGGQVISLLEVLANAVEKKEKARAGWMGMSTCCTLCQCNGQVSVSGDSKRFTIGHWARLDMSWCLIQGRHIHAFNNYLNDVFLKISLSLLNIEISISMLRIVFFNKLFTLKLILFLFIIFVSSSLFEPV